MTEADRAAALAEFFHGGPRQADPELAALEAALFAEDAFALVLSEAEIVPETCGDEAALAALVTAQLGRAS